jgi:hypothetical protein
MYAYDQNALCLFFIRLTYKLYTPVGPSPKVKYKTEYAYMLIEAETIPTNPKSLKSVQPLLSYKWCN